MGVKDSLMGRLLGSSGTFTADQVAQTVQLLIDHGVKRGASDIHLEPRDHHVYVRYRIDGTLHGMHKLPGGAAEALAARLKDMAGLRVENTMPQEGQFTTAAHVQVRLSTLPVVGGEKMVLHLSKNLGTPLPLHDLGLWGDNVTALQHILAHPHGLIVVTGPKRSGKSTTIHGLLGLLNTPHVSIATIEHSLEHQLPGITQSLAHPYSQSAVADGLQAVLRQDANIIMASNLPDKTAVQVGVQAAATGHLVIAGLHADDSASALVHLRSMGAEPFLLATVFRAAIAKRLARQLCPDCKERYIPSPAYLEKLAATFGISSAVQKRLHELESIAGKEGVGTDVRPNTTPAHITHLWRAAAHGCEHCHFTGFRGTVPITELLQASEQLQQLVLKEAKASALHAAALREGFIPLAWDGLIKSLRGLTTPEEIARVTGIHRA